MNFPPPPAQPCDWLQLSDWLWACHAATGCSGRHAVPDELAWMDRTMDALRGAFRSGRGNTRRETALQAAHFATVRLAFAARFARTLALPGPNGEPNFLAPPPSPVPAALWLAGPVYDRWVLCMS